MPALYIADGHHRSAAAALVGAEKAKQNPNHRGDEEYNYFMAVCFPANQLTIIDYNRVVKDLNGMTPEQFLTAVSKNLRWKKRVRTSTNRQDCIISPFIWMASGIALLPNRALTNDNDPSVCWTLPSHPT